MKISILIAEDHKLVRQAMKYSLNNNEKFQVVGESESGEQAVTLAGHLHPDIVLMDINLKGMSGIEATRLIRDYSPSTNVLCISSHDSAQYINQVVHNGAKGYITKNCSRTELYNAILEVYAGNNYFSEQVKNVIINDSLNLQKTRKWALSKRELEVCTHLKNGSTSKQISEALGITVKTVEVHRYNILRKFGLNNTASLMNYLFNNDIN